MSMDLPAGIRGRVRDSAPHRWLQRRRGDVEIRRWEDAGRPIPPPQVFKHSVIRGHAKQYQTRILVETGTHGGGTIVACLDAFDRLYSVELSDELFASARKRLDRFRKVFLRHGDSARELPGILEEIGDPALFWLDAHYSGAGTARGTKDTPIEEELQMIARHRVQGHVILIDDARCFDGTDGYPTLDGCRAIASNAWASHDVCVGDDIIQITPRR